MRWFQDDRERLTSIQWNKTLSLFNTKVEVHSTNVGHREFAMVSKIMLCSFLKFFASQHKKCCSSVLWRVESLMDIGTNSVCRGLALSICPTTLCVGRLKMTCYAFIKPCLFLWDRDCHCIQISFLLPFAFGVGVLTAMLCFVAFCNSIKLELISFLIWIVFLRPRFSLNNYSLAS